MGLDKFFLDRNDTVLLIVDIQERLAAVMEKRGHVIANCTRLTELAKMLSIPVLVSEQYPKGLGRTVPELVSVIPSYSPVEKLTFDCCGEPSYMEVIKKTGRKKAIVTGMETHICVLQTVLGLLKEGFDVHVVSDAVCSRTDANWKAGLDMMRDAGAVVTCTETVLFQALKVAGTEEFKAVSRMIK